MKRGRLTDTMPGWGVKCEAKAATTSKHKHLPSALPAASSCAIWCRTRALRTKWPQGLHLPEE